MIDLYYYSVSILQNTWPICVQCTISVDASLLLDPVQIVFSPGEASRVAHLAARGGTKWHNANLYPPLLGLIIPSQGTTRVSIACSLATSSVHAHHTRPNNAIDIVTLLVGDQRQILHHPEHITDAPSIVRGSPPPNGCHHLARISCLTWLW